MCNFLYAEERREALEERLQRRNASDREKIATKQRAKRNERHFLTRQAKRRRRRREYAEDWMASKRSNLVKGVARRIPAIVDRKFDGILQGPPDHVLAELKMEGALKDPNWGHPGARQQLLRRALELAIEQGTVQYMIDRRGVASLTVHREVEADPLRPSLFRHVHHVGRYGELHYY